MANKVIQLKDGSDNLYPKEPRKQLTVTFANYVDNTEVRAYQTGSIVCGHIVFKILSTIPAPSSGYIKIASGLPTPDYLNQFVSMCVGGTSIGTTARMAVRTDGEIGFYWSGTTPTSGQTYMCHFAYSIA